MDCTKKVKKHLRKSNLQLPSAAIAACLTAASYGADVVAPASDGDTNAPAAAKKEAFIKRDGTTVTIGSLPPVTFHGFVSQGYLHSDTYDYLGNSKDGSFEFTEAAVNASFNPFPRTRVTAQGFLFSVGNVGEYHPALDYASIDYTFRDEIGLRAGRIRRPEGIYNAIQDVDLARTSVLLPQGMYDARWRDFSGSVDGGSVFGNIGLKKAGSLSYEVYGGAVNLADNGGIARLLQDSFRNPPTAYAGIDGFPMMGMQLWYNTPIDGLRAGIALNKAFGFSYDYDLNIPPAFGGGRYHNEIDAVIQHYSLEYMWKGWTFQAEYKYSDYDNSTEYRGNTVATSESAADTWYVSAAYRFNNWLEVGSYYTEAYGNTDNRDGDGNPVPSDAYQKDLALSFRFDPKPWWIIKAEGHYIRGTGLIYNQADNPVRDEDGWFMLALKTTFSF
jgi:hypothetical protein